MSLSKSSSYEVAGKKSQTDFAKLGVVPKKSAGDIKEEDEEIDAMSEKEDSFLSQDSLALHNRDAAMQRHYDRQADW